MGCSPPSILSCLPLSALIFILFPVAALVTALCVFVHMAAHMFDATECLGIKSWSSPGRTVAFMGLCYKISQWKIPRVCVHWEEAQISSLGDTIDHFGDSKREVGGLCLFAHSI